MSDTRDFSERDPDKIVNAADTLERAQRRQEGQFPAVTFSELYSAVLRPPGKTELSVSRVPGSNLSPGVEVNGAAHRVAGTRGHIEEFPTIGGTATTALIRNLVSGSRFQAVVHAQGGTGPDDPLVVTHPHPDDAEMPPWAHDVISYPTSSAGDDGQPGQQTVRRV